ncbi:MAG: mandelate racemase/muconate lactonizing enzyme family protein [Nocardioidaceae bacterium]
MTARVTSVEGFPLVYPLPNGGYGSVRGRVRERTALVLRLNTSDGVAGWGEAFGPPQALLPLVQEVSEQVHGVEVDSVRPALTRLLQHTYHRGGAGLHVAVAGAVDSAAWDALGRLTSMSVGRLLGGRARDRVTPYASAGYVTERNDLGELRVCAESAVSRGYLGMKIKVGFGVREDFRRTQTVRDVLGPERALMVDFNGNCTADIAARILDALDELDIAWAEEPVPPEDLDGLRRLAHRTRVPLAAGEAVYNRQGFRALLDTRCLDVAQPDIGKMGGLTEAHFVTGMARMHNVRVSPHCWAGAVTLAGTLQLIAATPDYPHPVVAPEPMWLEYDQGDNALRDRLAGGPLPVKDGQVEIPDEPGLGISVDEDMLIHFSGLQP